MRATITTCLLAVTISMFAASRVVEAQKVEAQKGPISFDLRVFGQVTGTDQLCLDDQNGFQPKHANCFVWTMENSGRIGFERNGKFMCLEARPLDPLNATNVGNVHAALVECGSRKDLDLNLNVLPSRQWHLHHGYADASRFKAAKEPKLASLINGRYGAGFRVGKDAKNTVRILLGATKGNMWLEIPSASSKISLLRKPIPELPTVSIHAVGNNMNRHCLTSTGVFTADATKCQPFMVDVNHRLLFIQQNKVKCLRYVRASHAVIGDCTEFDGIQPALGVDYRMRWFLGETLLRSHRAPFRWRSNGKVSVLGPSRFPILLQIVPTPVQAKEAQLMTQDKD